MRIAIFCPLGVTTGGPEAIHQLCHEMRAQGIDAFLLPTDERRDRAEAYRNYNAPIIEDSQLRATDILITPEVKVMIPRKIYNAVEGKVIVWWLSVDNCPWDVSKQYSKKLSLVEKFSWPIEAPPKLNIRDRFYLFRKKILSDKPKTDCVAIDLARTPALAQSWYALEFLKKNHEGKKWLVSDYINTDFARKGNSSAYLASNSRREQIISYNAAKGGAFCESLIEFLPEFKFVPVKNMTRDQVNELLTESILYLDLGHFPGRDRMPREASLRNTFVALAKRGAAKYREDFPLEDRFLLDLLVETPTTAAVKIRQIAREAESNADSQNDLRDFVLENRNVFSQEVHQFLNDLDKMENWRS